VTPEEGKARMPSADWKNEVEVINVLFLDKDASDTLSRVEVQN